MSLAAGTRLGPYEVLGLIGSGGMGEVYKARDTRLDRTVAIKILPAELSADPDRRTRFEREARTVAALSHPHICTLHDIGSSVPSGPLPLAPGPLSLSPVHYLVMEYLAGETLAQRLARGPLPVAQALDIAAQIADALDVAHKHGIVHRDLKPGNVMLTMGGAGRSGVTVAKLLDFGLAKLAAHGERPALVGGASVPTMAAPVTAEGTILGTLQYMAPEQLEGKEADARTDLWALGAILYEMVTGRRAFGGESQVSLIGNIMNAEAAALATLQPLTPPSLERVVKKCLAKHPDDRWDTAHDVADELRWISQTSGASPVTGTRRPRRWGLRTALVAAAVLAGVMIGAGLMSLLRLAAPCRVALAPKPGCAPSRGAERWRGVICLDSHARRVPDGTDLDTGRAGTRVRRPPGRRAAALCAAARRRRGAPARGHRGGPGAGSVNRRPVGSLLGSGGDPEGPARRRPRDGSRIGRHRTFVRVGLGRPRPRVLRPRRRRPHLADLA
jgi:hypothetical protein